MCALFRRRTAASPSLRRGPGNGADRVELLENRLCLGSLAAGGDVQSAPTLPPADDDPAVTAQVSTESTGSDAAPIVLPQTPNSQSQQNTVQQPADDSTLEPPDSSLLETALGEGLLDAPPEKAADSSASSNEPLTTASGAEPSDDLPNVLVNDETLNSLASSTDQQSVAAMAEAGANTTSQTPTIPVSEIPWFDQSADPVVIRYDFRDLYGHKNDITAEQQAAAEAALQAWTEATDGRINWVRDTEAAAEEIVNIGVGQLTALGYESRAGGTLAVGGSEISATDGGGYNVVGAIWLDRHERWDSEVGNGEPEGTVDLFTVVAHEAGHVLGLEDSQQPGRENMMNGEYDGERDAAAFEGALASGVFMPISNSGGTTGFSLHAMAMPGALLKQSEVQQLLDRASAVSDTEDGIIAVVDRTGQILGVRVEQNVLDTIPDLETLVFAIDGAVAKARTAAFFSNGDPTNIDEESPAGTLAPLTSRLVRFISQSTVTEREVNANPNINDPLVRGPGYVAPIGLGAHFPPEIANTPPVDLFAIEHTNRDSLLHPGQDGIKGTADDLVLQERFNADPAFIPAGKELHAPESYGFASGLLPTAQARGIATLPGGIPLFRDTNGDGVGETLVGGIGVFFPGPDGFATFEQNFIPNSPQDALDRVNAPRVLEAEYTAFAAAGGSLLAELDGAQGAKIGEINGIAPVEGLDMPFGSLTLVGIELEVLGPIAGVDGVRQLLRFAEQNLDVNGVSGALAPLAGGAFTRDGQAADDGWLVAPHDSLVDDLTAADVEQIVADAIEAAEITRAAVRLDASDRSPGARTRMVFAVTDTSGEILGLFRMQDATIFSIDVAVAKARNTAYYADATALQPIDQIQGVEPGVAFTNRTFRFVAEPRFPDGVERTPPGPFSILNNPSIDPNTGENIAGPAPADSFDSVLGHDSFHPMSNFRDPDNIANQNGIVFFPGSTPIYKDGQLIGGFGVSGDGVDQDDVVTYLASEGFRPENNGVKRADQTIVRGVRLPYIKFLRNPFG